MEQVKRYRIAVLAGVGAVVLSLILFAVVVSPQGKKLSTLNAKKVALTTQQSTLEAQLATLRTEKAQFVPNCEALAKALTQIPVTTDASSFLQQVTNLAKQSGDPNTPSFSLPQTGTTKSSVTAIQFSLTLTGTYGQMTSFLQGLNTLPRLFTVSTINVTGGNLVNGGGQLPAAGTGGYNLSLTGSIYYAASQKNVCGGVA
jgi:Tfp pilus assembly protein PilO